jgi:hypothetical protein
MPGTVLWLDSTVTTWPAAPDSFARRAENALYVAYTLHRARDDDAKTMPPGDETEIRGVRPYVPGARAWTERAAHRHADRGAERTPAHAERNEPRTASKGPEGDSGPSLGSLSAPPLGGEEPVSVSGGGKDRLDF